MRQTLFPFHCFVCSLRSYGRSLIQHTAWVFLVIFFPIHLYQLTVCIYFSFKIKVFRVIPIHKIPLIICLKATQHKSHSFLHLTCEGIFMPSLVLFKPYLRAFVVLSRLGRSPLVPGVFLILFYPWKF